MGLWALGLDDDLIGLGCDCMLKLRDHDPRTC